MMAKTNKLKITVIFIFVFMAAYAVSMGMYGTVLPEIIKAYGINLKSASWFNIMNDVGQMVAMGFTILIVDKINKNKLIGIMALLMGAIMLSIGTAPLFLIFLMMRVLLGMTSSIIDSLCSAYISDLYGDQRSRYITILHMIYGVGSLLGPQYAARMVESNMGWNSTYLALGTFIVVTGILFLATMFFMGTPAPAVSNKDESGKIKKIPYLEMLRSRNMIILCIASFLLAGNIFYNTWLPTYLSRLDSTVYTIGVTSLIATAYYVGMIASRFIYASISNRLKADDYLRYSGFFSAALITVGLLSGNMTVWVIVNFLFGLIGGTAYTAKFILACVEYPEFSATAIAMTGVAAGIGGITFSAVGGAIADAGSFLTAMFLPVSSFLAVSLLFLLGYKSKKV